MSRRETHTAFSLIFNACCMPCHVATATLTSPGGDFMMSTTSDNNFLLLLCGHSWSLRLQVVCCGDLVRWKTRIVSALGVSSCTQRPYELQIRPGHMHDFYSIRFPYTWLWITRPLCSRLPVFRHLRITELPGSDSSIMRSEHVGNKEGLRRTFIKTRYVLHR